MKKNVFLGFLALAILFSFSATPVKADSSIPAPVLWVPMQSDMLDHSGANAYYLNGGSTNLTLQSSCLMGGNCGVQSSATNGFGLVFTLNNSFPQNGTAISFWYNGQAGGWMNYFDFPAYKALNQNGIALDSYSQGQNPINLGLVVNNTWSFITETCANNSNVGYFYINGTFENTGYCDSQEVANNIYLMGSPNLNQGAQGQIFFYAFYNSSFTQAQVTRLFVNDSGNPLAGIPGAQCQQGYYFIPSNQTCAPIPGYQATAPLTRLIVWDNGCGGNLLIGGILSTCNNLNPIEQGLDYAQDWITAGYSVNGQQLTPAQGARCSVNFLNGSSVAMDYQNPAAQVQSYVNEPSTQYWSAKVSDYAPNCLLGDCSKVNTYLTVTCNSTVPQSGGIVPFFVQNTMNGLVQDSFNLGNGGNNNDVINSNAPNAQYTHTIISNPAPYGQTTNPGTLCNTTIPAINLQDVNFSATLLQSLGNNNYESIFSNSFTPPTLPGYYYASSACSSQLFNGTTRIGNIVFPNDVVSRQPSIFIGKSFQVINSCSNLLNNASSARVYTADRNGSMETNYTNGQNVYIYAKYFVPSQTADNYQNGVCNLIIYNYTNATNPTPLIPYQAMRGGQAWLNYFAWLSSNPNDTGINSEPNFDGAWAINLGGFGITPPQGAHENFSVNITCSNSDSNFCIQPANASQMFSVIGVDSCPGSQGQCTLGICSPCPFTQVTCPDNATVGQQLTCVSRACLPPDQADANSCVGHNAYSLQVSSSPTQDACGEDNYVISTELIAAQGGPVPMLTGGPSDMRCGLEIAPVLNGNVNTYSALTYDLPLSDGISTPFSLSGKINSLRQSTCGGQMQVQVTCASNSFVGGTIQDFVNINVGSGTSSCAYGQYTVKDSQCVSSVTGRDADKGIECAGGLLVNASTLCSCPSGTTFDSATNGCDGALYQAQAGDWFSFYWLTPPVAIGIILFGGLAIAGLALLLRRSG